MRKNLVRYALVAAMLGILPLTAAGACDSDADVVSSNISKDAENFKILRRIVFLNGITDKYILLVEGYCSVDPSPVGKIAVTCKLGRDKYAKHFLGEGDNVTWFAEQIEGASVSADHYKVIFKPEAILPVIETR